MRASPQFTPGDPAGCGEFFRTAANRMTDLLSTYTEEGMCYRVDLRLRPDGRFGEVCHSLEGAKQYYASRGRDWELQMLIKARVAAGDPGPGRELLDFVEPLIYRTTTDFRTIEAVSETRARMHEKLRLDRQRHTTPPGASMSSWPKAASATSNFSCSVCSVCTAGANPGSGTAARCSLFRVCATRSFCLRSNTRALLSAYQFLRHLEHRLQFDEDRQTHTLPDTKEDIDLLARKMPRFRACPAPARSSANSITTSPACRISTTASSTRSSRRQQPISGGRRTARRRCRCRCRARPRLNR